MSEGGVCVLHSLRSTSHPNLSFPSARLKLETSLSTSNMHLFNAEGQIVKYESPLDVLKVRPTLAVSIIHTHIYCSMCQLHTRLY